VLHPVKRREVEISLSTRPSSDQANGGLIDKEPGVRHTYRDYWQESEAGSHLLYGCVDLVPPSTWLMTLGIAVNHHEVEMVIKP
jgi:hypothetical protein